MIYRSATSERSAGRRDRGSWHPAAGCGRVVGDLMVVPALSLRQRLVCGAELSSSPGFAHSEDRMGDLMDIPTGGGQIVMLPWHMGCAVGEWKQLLDRGNASRQPGEEAAPNADAVTDGPGGADGPRFGTPGQSHQTGRDESCVQAASRGIFAVHSSLA